MLTEHYLVRCPVSLESGCLCRLPQFHILVLTDGVPAVALSCPLFLKGCDSVLWYAPAGRQRTRLVRNWITISLGSNTLILCNTLTSSPNTKQTCFWISPSSSLSFISGHSWSTSLPRRAIAPDNSSLHVRRGSPPSA